MKKIIASLIIIAATATIATVAVKTTVSLLSDTETSSGNTFAAGAIDLKIDNESYYNGQLIQESSWKLSDLDDGQGPAEGAYLFFNFADLKPGDWGEDTISIHVGENDAWACAELKLTSNDDVSSLEPELEDGDAQEEANDNWDGELAQNLRFIWWADDGDNVLETDERAVFNGTLGDMINASSTAPTTLTLADSQWDMFTDQQPGTTLEGERIYYIGKAWCFGEMILTQVDQGDNNSPTIDPGFTCDGSALNNVTQTDQVTGNLSFLAIQARHNDDYLCPEHLAD